MNELKLKRETFRESINQMIRNDLFQRNRVKQQIANHQVNQLKELQFHLNLQVQTLQILIQNLEDSDEKYPEIQEFSDQIAQVIEKLTEILDQDQKRQANEEIILEESISLGGIINQFRGLAFYMRKNYENEKFPKLLEFLEKCAYKEMVFCHEYCRSGLYHETLTLLKRVDKKRIETEKWIEPINKQRANLILRHLAEIGKLQPHVIDFSLLNDLIHEVSLQIYNKDNLIVPSILNLEMKQIAYHVVECFFQLNLTFTQRLDMRNGITRYFLSVILNQTSSEVEEEFLLNGELLRYLSHFKENTQNLDQLSIQLISQMSFNPLLRNYPDESAVALGIIGNTLSGNTERTNYYFDKFSESVALLDKRLIDNLRVRHAEVKRASAFALSNIFAEANLRQVNVYLNNTVNDFFEIVQHEANPSVYQEILICLANLIINAKDSEFGILLFNNNIIGHILRIDDPTVYKQVVKCLLFLHIAAQRLHQEKRLLSLYDQHGVRRYVQRIASAVPNFEKKEKFKALCNIIFQ